MENRINIVEPFPLFGGESIIHSKEQAVRVLKLNSYYIFVAAFISLFGFVSISIFNLNIGISGEYVLLFALILFTIGSCIRWLKSRVASVISLIIFLFSFFWNLYERGFAGFYILTLLFIAASYRSTKASFFYHKKA